MATYSVKISTSSETTPSVSQTYWNSEYNFNNYARPYVGDSFTVTTSKLSTLAACGFKYASAVLDGFTKTTTTVSGKSVYGMTGTFTEAHLGSHSASMGSTTAVGQKFNYTVFGVYRATLAYNANGGSGAPGSSTLTQDSSSQTAPSIWFTISGTTPSRSGYVFKGWDTNSSASSASYQPGGSISLSSSLSGITTTLYAIWWAYWYAKLSYNANGGTGAPSDWYTNTTSYYQPGNTSTTCSSTTPTRTNYTFKGWADSSSASSAQYVSGNAISIPYSQTNTTTKTVYAVWWGNWYSILRYDANGGTGAPGIDYSWVISYTKPSFQRYTISSTVPTKEGKTFLGWATSPTATTPTHHAGDFIDIEFEIGSISSPGTTLYAVWEDTKAKMHANVGGIWKTGDVYVNQGGTWVQPQKVYGKKDGVWKEGV